MIWVAWHWNPLSTGENPKVGGELGPVTVGVEQTWLHGSWHVAMRLGLVGPMLMPWTLTLQLVPAGDDNDGVVNWWSWWPSGT